VDERNHEVLALAYRRAKAKSLKIKELAITSDMKTEDVDTLITALSKKKAEESEQEWTEHVKGQRWYVEDLVEFSKLGAQERLDYEYQQCFADLASEDEMLAELGGLV